MLPNVQERKTQTFRDFCLSSSFTPIALPHHAHVWVRKNCRENNIGHMIPFRWELFRAKISVCLHLGKAQIWIYYLTLHVHTHIRGKCRLSRHLYNKWSNLLIFFKIWKLLDKENSNSNSFDFTITIHSSFLPFPTTLISWWDEVVTVTVMNLVWSDHTFLLCCSHWKCKQWVWSLILLVYFHTNMKVATKMSMWSSFCFQC